MLKFQFKKLVRDGIVDQQIASGAKPHYRKLAQNELREEFVKKIQEEASEIISASNDTIATEIADVQQAIDDLIVACKLEKSDIANRQRVKNEKYGSFSEGMYIEYLEIGENHKWFKYYRENSDKYPRIQ